jgi:hypothetical protein
MSQRRNIDGLNVSINAFIHKFPHIFKVFMDPIRRNLCCRIRQKIREEENDVNEWELEAM